MKTTFTLLFICAFAHSAICMEPMQAPENLCQAILRKAPHIKENYLERGADANQIHNWTFTPLSLALHCNQPELIQPLLDAGANLDSALFYAVKAGHRIVCKELMLLGANPHAKNSEGKAAFDLIQDHWLDPNNIRQILMKEDTWRGWIRSQLRTVSLCCGCHKHKLE